MIPQEGGYDSVYDGDNRDRDAVAQVPRKQALEELRNAQWVEEGNVDTGS
jgi:hypothetical protein